MYKMTWRARNRPFYETKLANSVIRMTLVRIFYEVTFQKLALNLLPHKMETQLEQIN